MMEVPHEERRMYSEKELAVFKPKPLSGNFTNMRVTHQIQSTRVAPITSHQTGVIPTVQQNGMSASQYHRSDTNEQNIPSYSHQVDMIPTKCTMKFVIETSKVGLLIGKNGSNIKHIIQNMSSCRISVHGKSYKYGGYSSATIIGNEDQCNRAREMINVLVRECRI
eukprot:scaffold25009_cov71-Cyclotella_meneghiniana.AAC.5